MIIFICISLINFRPQYENGIYVDDNIFEVIQNGNIKRAYIKTLTSHKNAKEISNCDQIIGLPFIYDEENGNYVIL